MSILLLVAGVTLVLTGTPSPKAPLGTSATDAASISTQSTAVGDCFSRNLGEKRSYEPRPCSEAHDTEIFAAQPFSGGWPGAPENQDKATQQCLTQTQAFLGDRLATTELSLEVMYQPQSTWKSGDPLICGLHHPAQPITGSLRGTSTSHPRLKVGDCVSADRPSDPDTMEPTEIGAVACNKPHAGEYFAQLSIDVSPYPGTAAVEARAKTFCLTAFISYFGLPVSGTDFEVRYSGPPSEHLVHDNRISCIALHPLDGGPLTRSYAKSGYQHSDFIDYLPIGCYRDSTEHAVRSRCDEPHIVEVYRAVTLPGTVRPTQSVIDTWAKRQCAAGLTDTAQLTPGWLQFGFAYPGADEWEQGYHHVRCFIAHSGNEPFTGSIMSPKSLRLSPSET